jgi:hypothetical protein
LELRQVITYQIIGIYYATTIIEKLELYKLSYHDWHNNNAEKMKGSCLEMDTKSIKKTVMVVLVEKPNYMTVSNRVVSAYSIHDVMKWKSVPLLGRMCHGKAAC